MTGYLKYTANTSTSNAKELLNFYNFTLNSLLKINMNLKL